VPRLVECLSFFQAISLQDKSSKQNDKSSSNKDNSSSKNRLTNLPNEQVSNYPFANKDSENSDPNFHNQILSNLHPSSISFNFANIQTKLKVGQPGDIYEQEADRIAEQIMSSKLIDQSFTESIKPNEKINRKCSSCKNDEEENEEKMKISRKETTGTISNSADKFEISDNQAEEINNTLIRSGSPLNSSTREFMESHFGYDFSSIRVHSDNVAAKSAKSINALAYTIGNNIIFGTEEYAPCTTIGKKLLAHELTHVIQHGSLKVGSVQRQQQNVSIAPHKVCNEYPSPSTQVNSPVTMNTNTVLRYPPLLKPSDTTIMRQNDENAAQEQDNVTEGPDEAVAASAGPIVSPEAFVFHIVIPYDGQGTGGWKETDCVTIRFVKPGGLFSPPAFFDCGLLVGVPIVNYKGRVTDLWAQDLCAIAAQTAGAAIVSLLMAGKESPVTNGPVCNKLATIMQPILAAQIPGALVKRCTTRG
jgi:hypothetical protein